MQIRQSLNEKSNFVDSIKFLGNKSRSYPAVILTWEISADAPDPGSFSLRQVQIQQH